MKTVAVIIGTRPEGIKMAPVIHALQASELLEPVLINSGQHEELLDQVLDVFELQATYNLRVMRANQSLAKLTSVLMEKVDEALVKSCADYILVQGDTTTVLCGSLAGFYLGIPIGHVEAGLRSGDISSPFPEEANRILASKLVTQHFAPTLRAQQSLLTEGVRSDDVFVTGNTVIDALNYEVKRQESSEAETSSKLEELLGQGWQQKQFILVTAHRRESFGGGVDRICKALQLLAIKYPEIRIVYPVHLNPNVRGPVHAALKNYSNVVLVPPQPYSEFVSLLRACYLVLTDSGGVQEEGPSLGKPVVVMRENTERQEGVEAGTVRLVGTNVEDIVDGVSKLVDSAETYQDMAHAENPYGDGTAAIQIVGHIENFFRDQA